MLLITLPGHMRSSPLLSVVHVALALVLCIVLCLFKLFSIVNTLKHVFCDNTIEKQLVELGLFLFHSMVYYYFAFSA
jgi:4-amino-4-deoxy-L-arabinose transferase-like glycosyltransferase